jgi:hypothetical protein
MGDPFVGIVHPCKIYNILALGIPFLYIGPDRSHITELMASDGIGENAHRVGHGDVEGVIDAIKKASVFRSGPSPAGALLALRFSEAAIVPRLINLIERLALGPIPADKPPLGSQTEVGFDPQEISSP